LSLLSGVVWAAQPASPARPSIGLPQITLSGKVTDFSGQPVEGAKVMLCQLSYGSNAYLPKARIVDEKSTGAEGTFAFTTAKDTELDEVGSVIARKEGLALGWGKWMEMRADQHVDITLGEPKSLTGQVVDEKEQPVADAEVGMAMAMLGRPEDQRYWTDWLAPGLLKVRTDDAGRFLFANMPAEATCEFFAGKLGRATICTFDVSSYRGEKGRFSVGQTGIKLTLPPEAVIQGIVVEETSGRPVGGIQVQALSEQQRGAIPPPEAVSSSGEGAFRLRGLAPGSYTLQLPSIRGQIAAWVAEPVPVSVKTGETKNDIKLLLTKGAIIEVLVKESGGKPIVKANVNVRSGQRNQSVEGSTDENGLARIHVTAGQYSIFAPYREGYTLQGNSEERVGIEEGQTKRVEFTLSTLPKISGIVRDEAGHPLAGVKLEVKPMGRDETNSDASGKFEAAWDPRMWGPQGTTLVLVARDVAHNLAEAVDLDEQGGSLDVKLKPGVTVTGSVLSEGGKPLPGARIRVSLRASRWSSSLGRGELATADPEGKFVVKALPPEREYTVTAVANGYGKRDVPVDPANIKDNHFEAGPFKLTPATLSISGIVVDPNDQPVAGASVYGYGNGQPDLGNIQTDNEGKFTIKGVCPGSIRLNVNTRTPPYRYANLEVEGGATDVKIVISGQPSGQGYMPRRPASLKGKPLPPLKDLGIELPAEAEGKMLLVCFWDMGQRPSRYCVTQLAARAAPLGEKSVMIVAVHATKVEDNALSQWVEQNKLPFKVGSIAGDIEKTKFAWGVASLPNLILTDKKHVVVAEGFGVNELDKQIEAITGR
jgi:protocatechuate 3,4-dioxygenase beta subunit